MVLDTEVEEAVETEDDRVLRWRIDQLLAAGYDGHAALIIGLDRDIDLHTATGLLCGGCPVDTALQILF